MQARAVRFFIFFAGVILCITAIAKFVSASGNARILYNPDPILIISFQKVFWFVGILELFIALFFFFGKKIEFQLGL
jgi:hypothetical protein